MMHTIKGKVQLRFYLFFLTHRVCFGLLWNLDYYINARVINGVIFASFVSVLLSTYCSTNLCLRLKSAYSFNTRNFISLIVCAIVDGVVMAGLVLRK